MAKKVAKGQKTITKLDDGYTIRLAPPAIVIPTNSDGSNPVLTAAKARLFLEKGGINVPLTITSVVGTGCTAAFTGIETRITGISATEGSVAIYFTGTDGYVSNTQINFVISKQGVGGEPGITILLDNETHALPASYDGTVAAAALDTARTKIMVFKGATQLTAVAANATPGAGQFRYNVDTVTGGSAVRIDNSNVRLSAIAADQAIINLNIYAENLTAVYTKQMTITKVREGKPGEKGSKGALPLYRGEYNKDDYGNSVVQTYYGTDNRSDIVQLNGQFYFAKETAGVFNNIAPTDPGQTKWEVFGSQLQSIATGLLFADKAYVKNLIVQYLSSGTDDNLPRLLAQGGEIGFYKNRAAESSVTNALLRIGMEVGYMQSNGSNKPGLSIRDRDGDNSYSEITSEGVFSNGSNINAISVTSGISSAFSIAALLQSRVNGSIGSPSINAAIYGADQTSNSSASYSEGYAAYFQGTVAINGALISSQGGSGYNGDTVPMNCRYYQIYHDNIYLPNAPITGHTLTVRNNSNSSKTLRAQGGALIYVGDGMPNSTIYSMARSLKLELVYDGTNWVVY